MKRTLEWDRSEFRVGFDDVELQISPGRRVVREGMGSGCEEMRVQTQVEHERHCQRTRVRLLRTKVADSVNQAPRVQRVQN